MDETEVPPGLYRDLWIDGAYTKNTDNDPTGMMVCAFHRQLNRLYIFHAQERYMEMPELLEEIPDYCVNHELDKRSRVYIEPKASGHSLRQMLKDVTNLSPVFIEGPLVQEGKEARANVAAPG